MVTFKEFLLEGQSYFSKLYESLGEIKKELAANLGVRSYRILVERTYVFGEDERGNRIKIVVPIPPELDDEVFFEKMTNIAVKKSMAKHFDRFAINPSENVPWDTGKAIYMIAVVPDADGLMP